MPGLGGYYLRARYYQPSVGRFLTRDEFSGFQQEPMTLNKYLYANANPVMGVDPSGRFVGLQSVTIGVALVGTLGSLTIVSQGNPFGRPNVVNGVVRDDLGPRGNLVRNLGRTFGRLSSDFEFALFEFWWLKKGAIFSLTSQLFRDVKSFISSRKAVDVSTVNHPSAGQLQARKYSFYKSEKFDAALGTATVFFDLHGNAVGLYDLYDFDPKPFSGPDSRDTVFAEVKTRAVAAFATDQVAVEVVYGVHVRLRP